MFLLIIEEEEYPIDDSLLMELRPKPQDKMGSPTAQISLHTLSSQLALEALRLVGCVSSQEVVISIDGGSTPNFIQTHLAQVLGLPAKPIKPLRVLVGHGHEIECHHLFADVPVIVQRHSFAIDLHVLSFSGIDPVLGVQWLKSLGLVLTDYNDLMMKFLCADRVVELKGDTNLELLTISPLQFAKREPVDSSTLGCSH